MKDRRARGWQKELRVLNRNAAGGARGRSEATGKREGGAGKRGGRDRGREGGKGGRDREREEKGGEGRRRRRWRRRRRELRVRNAAGGTRGKPKAARRRGGGGRKGGSGRKGGEAGKEETGAGNRRGGERAEGAEEAKGRAACPKCSGRDARESQSGREEGREGGREEKRKRGGEKRPRMEANGCDTEASAVPFAREYADSANYANSVRFQIVQTHKSKVKCESKKKRGIAGEEGRRHLQRGPTPLYNASRVTVAGKKTR